MKIASCTVEMITLIFLLFWSFNGASQVLAATEHPQSRLLH